MARPDDLVAAGVFASRETADAAWGAVAARGVPCSVITEPGIMGRHDHLVMVHREDLEEAQGAIAEILPGPPPDA